MSVRIRKMTIRDYEAAIALWRSLPGIGLDDASDSRAGIAALLRRNPGLSFVAVEGGTVVGTALAGHDGRRGFIYHLAVAPSQRKHGLGREMTDRSLRALAACGVPKCSIMVLSANTDGEAFWRRIGWIRRDDLLVLQHALEPPRRKPPPPGHLD